MIRAIAPLLPIIGANRFAGSESTSRTGVNSILSHRRSKHNEIWRSVGIAAASIAEGSTRNRTQTHKRERKGEGTRDGPVEENARSRACVRACGVALQALCQSGLCCALLLGSVRNTECVSCLLTCLRCRARPSETLDGLDVPRISVLD